MIVVRETNMPNNCEECKFCINQETNDYGSFGECLLQKSRVNCLNSSRDTDCSLVEIVTCKDCKYNIANIIMKILVTLMGLGYVMIIFVQTEKGKSK